jgi:hypothetical protein
MEPDIEVGKGSSLCGKLSGKRRSQTGQKSFDTIFDPTKTKKGIQSQGLSFPIVLCMAEKERFELSMDYNTHTRLAGELRVFLVFSNTLKCA